MIFILYVNPVRNIFLRYGEMLALASKKECIHCQILRKSVFIVFMLEDSVDLQLPKF